MKYLDKNGVEIKAGQVAAYSERPFDGYADAIGFINDDMRFQALTHREGSESSGFVETNCNDNLPSLKFHSESMETPGVLTDLMVLDDVEVVDVNSAFADKFDWNGWL